VVLAIPIALTMDTDNRILSQAQATRPTYGIGPVPPEHRPKHDAK